MKSSCSSRGGYFVLAIVLSRAMEGTEVTRMLCLAFSVHRRKAGVSFVRLYLLSALFRCFPASALQLLRRPKTIPLTSLLLPTQKKKKKPNPQEKANTNSRNTTPYPQQRSTFFFFSCSLFSKCTQKLCWLSQILCWFKVTQLE